MGCPDCEPLAQRVVKLEKALEAAYQSECRLKELEDKYQRHIENANSIIMRIDRKGNILAINNFATDFFGYRQDEMVGKNLVGTIVPEKETTGRDLKKMVSEIGEFPEKYLNNINENMRKDGTTVWVNWTNKPVYSDSGEIDEIFCIGNDFTEFKAAEEKLEYIAFHDQLTGLYNRKMFMRQFEESLRQAKRYELMRAVLFIDLDNFKKVNDTLGHECGDILLAQAADRMREAVRDSDILCRFGGDEFVILLINPGDIFPDNVSRRVQESLSQPFILPKTIVDYISPSIGISIFPNDGDDTLGLIRAADEAMYRAKKAGRNRFVYYSTPKVDSNDV